MMAAGLPADTIIHMTDKVNAVTEAQVLKAVDAINIDASVTGILLPQEK
jgi:5,10-methylene-tetrahydrofolate dehydrogenase/methenyl tetrahydrofolate cyclohydrolase